MPAWLKANTGDLNGAGRLYRRYRKMPDADPDEAKRLAEEYPEIGIAKKS